MLIQSLFFEDFYITEKTKRLKNNVENFRYKYNTEIANTKELVDYVYEFENKNNSQIAFLTPNGVIKFIRQPLPKQNSSTDTEVIILAIKNWQSSHQNYFDVLISRKTITFKFKNPILNTDSLVVVSPIVINNSVQEILFVVSPLQPVGEAASVMKKYYIYVFIAALIMIAILSLIYSKMISKPLITLNNTASKMATLNFSAQCDINSKDEIGNLASTLNFLSHKLSTTLSKLREANKKLLKDIEKERQLEKMRKEFVAGVSHELKTPISLIEGYAEGLKDGIVEEEDKEYYLNVIIDESKKMNTLIKDMLDLSQLESTGYTLNISEINIYELVYSIYKKHVNNIDNKILRLNFNLVDKNELVNGDAFRIEEVITNLISNAIRYSYDNSEIIINVKNAGDKIFIEIENEGEHIKEKDLNLIWNKFYRIDKSRSKKTGGTGLGLSIVKNILELHNSIYGVKNTEKGVNFYFTLDKCKSTYRNIK
jgi:signal transduction histidine kinase